MSVQKARRLEIGILVAIAILALGLRLWGIGFGLPYEYHVDEVQYVRQAAQMGASGLEPVWWNNPPFHKYVLLAEFACLYLLGRGVGWYSSTADFGAQNSLDPTLLYLLGRATSAILGVLTVLVAYWLGKWAYNSRVGLLSAFFLAVSFLPVREAHYAVNDTAAAFWMMLVLLCSVLILKTGRLRWYILGGVALGLGFATKYSALLAVVPLTIAHFCAPGIQWRKMALPRLAAAYVMTVVAAIVSSPYFILRAGQVWHDVYEALYLAGRYGFEGWQIDPEGGYIFYLKTLGWGLGWALAALGLMGVIAGLWRHRKADIVLLSLPVFAYLLMGGQKMYFARFLLPMIPPLIILGSAAFDRFISDLLPKHMLKRVVLALGIVIFAAQPVISSIQHDALLTRTDTRTIAKQWVEINVPEGARIAMDWPFHCVPLSTVDTPAVSSKKTYEVTTVGGKGLSDHPLEWYREMGFDYLIVSSFISEIPLADQTRNLARKSFYVSLNSELKLIEVFRPFVGAVEPLFIFDEIYGPAVSLWQRERPGPTIKIYQVN